jgi:hypothetical protein
MNLKSFKRFLLLVLFSFGIIFSSALCAASRPVPVPSSILVDQFGYRPQDAKIAVIRGTNAAQVRRQAGHPFQVRNLNSQEVVYTAKATLWHQGNRHSQSGDFAAWFDFSTVTQPGTYAIVDAQSGEQSFAFEIATDIYRKLLVTATRMFFYQRSGFPKKTPYADARWQDDAAFLGPGQDTEARFVNDKQNASLARDLRGGWFDAGDTNKYVTFAATPVHQLLSAYTQAPAVWTDDFNIPESGNGLPDLIDEIRFELDWLQRMQDDDGGVFIKLGTLDYNSADKPSRDRRPRYYGPKCSSSTIAAAGMFAHAALVLGDFPELADEADALQKRAALAWRWFNTHPLATDCDTQEIKAGDADMEVDEQKGAGVTAAIYLFALTPRSEYTDYIRRHLDLTRPFYDNVWSRYQPSEGDALLFYTRLPGADAALRDRILSRFQSQLDHSSDAYGLTADLDPYRAYMPDAQYSWGSNSVKANYGNTNYDAILYGRNLDQHQDYAERALASLHYLHGVNPIGMVYLSNLYDEGADYSANEMHHEWFGQGIYSNALSSPSGPAPGYLTGGPNKNYNGSDLLQGQPPMKAYLDTNDPQLKSWQLTEPAIYYQSAYLKLLSKFLAAP